MLDATAARQVEMQILPHAKNLTTGQLPRIVERAVIAADPGSANARHERERVARDVTVRPLDDGMSLLEAYLCAEEPRPPAGRWTRSPTGRGGTTRAPTASDGQTR